MKTLSEITAYIQPTLEEVEVFRKEKLEARETNRIWFLIPFFSAVISVLALLTGTILLAGICIMAAIFSAGFIQNNKINPHINAFQKNYKDQILSTFVQLVYPKASFEANKKISRQNFEASELFNTYDNYFGEDYFRGTTENGTNFEFSELKVENVTTDSDGDRQTHTVFKGLFFVIDTNKEISSSRVHVVPDTAEKMMGFIGKMLQKSLGSLFQGAQMVYMDEHPEFEKEFVVYAKDKASAYRVLTPALIGVIYHLKYEWNAPLRLSFIGSKIYIALELTKNCFDADINRSLLSSKNIAQLYNELSLCFTLIESLSDIENIPKNYDPSANWTNSAYDHLNDSNNPFLC